MKARNIPLAFLLLVSLAACSYQVEVITPAPVAPVTPTFTPWVEGTEMALASPTPPATLPPFEVTQEVIEKPVGFSPVLYGGKVYDSEFFLLLGGASTDAWISPEESVSRFSGEVTYNLSNMTQQAKYFLWGQAPQYSNTCKSYTVRADAGLTESGFVGVVDGWAITKRPVDELSSDSEIYRRALIDWLTEQGTSDPQLDSVHIYRVDLEGDGSDEIFLSATHLDASQHTTKAGDYSIVLMRKVIGNTIVTKLVAGDVYTSKELEITYPNTYSLTNFIDLNQDGVLEVVLDVKAWEKVGAVVYTVHDQTIQEVLRTIC